MPKDDAAWHLERLYWYFVGYPCCEEDLEVPSPKAIVDGIIELMEKEKDAKENRSNS